MMLFLTVAMVQFVALMSPGPDFFFVSQTAASRSRKEAMMGVLGISLGGNGVGGHCVDGFAPVTAKNGMVARCYYHRRWIVSVLDGMAHVARSASQRGVANG